MAYEMEEKISSVIVCLLKEWNIYNYKLYIFILYIFIY